LFLQHKGQGQLLIYGSFMEVIPRQKYPCVCMIPVVESKRLPLIVPNAFILRRKSLTNNRNTQ